MFLDLNEELSAAGLRAPTEIYKRDGSLTAFDGTRISKAVSMALEQTESLFDPDLVVQQALRALSARHQDTVPSVEDVQDCVQMALFGCGLFATAKHFIEYRAARTAERNDTPVPDHVKAAFDLDSSYFPTSSQRFQFYDKYSRFDYELGRRRTWPETVNNSSEFLRELSGDMLDGSVYDEINQMMLEMRVMPSMRLLAMAGPAARRNHLALYNCSYLPVKDIQCFKEAMLISMAGCGVGYSVEREYVEQFSRVKRQKKSAPLTTHYVEDTTEGWGEAVQVGLETWWDGRDIQFNYDFVRPAGAILKTKGGRASGPAPLREFLDFARALLLSRQGGHIKTIDAHDLMCKIGDASIAGGVRRTALIALFDYDDQDMLNCKSGRDLDNNPQRWNANNSAVWPENIDDLSIIEQMTDMIRGQRGEPGIFSRENAKRTKPRRRKTAQFGTNPCGEINLRNFGLCNLSVAVARAGDSEEDLMHKVRVATIIGTIQSMATNFPGMREEWVKNCEEERLLGVDITGQLDCELLNTLDGDAIRDRLTQHAIETNREYAELLGINASASITCNKPSGNSSELLDCASGIHARHSAYYIRNMRVSATSALYKVLREAGAPMDPENGQTEANATTWVVHFPKKSPEGAVVKADRSAVDQCNFWLLNKQHWTEHNPSCTITYVPEEILELISWVVQHKDVIGGLSFLPLSEARYSQMPYETVDQATYERLEREFPTVDYSLVYTYEYEDHTTASRELACVSGTCELP